tara:strand:- start:921 stop:1079 length:159 start_codon:yes stop_codon:yes gene_type:complete
MRQYSRSIFVYNGIAGLQKRQLQKSLFSIAEPIALQRQKSFDLPTPHPRNGR